MVSNVFVVDQAAQVYTIYSIIYVCVGTAVADATGHTQNLLKIGISHLFWNTRYFHRYAYFSSWRCKKPSYFKILIRNTWYFDRRPKFSIEILGILIEIIGFSFEILGISKIYDDRIPHWWKIFKRCLVHVCRESTCYEVRKLF